MRMMQKETKGGKKKVAALTMRFASSVDVDVNVDSDSNCCCCLLNLRFYLFYLNTRGTRVFEDLPFCLSFCIIVVRALLFCHTCSTKFVHSLSLFF